VVGRFELSERQSETTASNESAIGEIPVTAKLARGYEYLTLFVTSRRIIVDHGRKRGAGIIATSPLLGQLGETFEGRTKTGKADSGTPKPGQFNPDQILSAHKDNFQIPYTEVVDVEIAGNLNSATITVLTKDDKLVFSAQMRLDYVRDLFSGPLGQRVRTSRLRPGQFENGRRR